MQTGWKKIIAAVAISCAAGGIAHGAEPLRERVVGGDMLKGMTGGDAAARVGTYAALLGAFRDSFTDKPGEAAEYWFSKEVRSEWSTEVSGEMIPQQVTDFFTGGIMLAGGSDRKGAVAGVYNPWWDAILLVQVSCRETKSGEEDNIYRMVTALDGMPGAPRAQVTEFYLLSGETFRGETDAGALPSVRTVVPEKDPLAVELWRVTAGTRKRFEELFPLEGENTWGEFAQIAAAVDKHREMERIQTRSAVRLRLTMEFLKNVREVGIAAQVAELIRHGSHYRLCDHFPEPASRPLLKTLADMPKVFRKDFTPYGHVATEEATLYVFVNVKVPRLFVTVTLPRDRKKTPPSLEWYDLLQSEQLLAAWNSRKEVAK